MKNKEENPQNANQDCPGISSDLAGKSSACDGCPNQSACASGANKSKEQDPAIEQVKQKLSEIKHIILVLSGKGGVGKSTISSQIAFSLSKQNQDVNVGILDIDICGPSIPRLMGIENQQVHSSNLGWEPIYVEENLSVMSIGFMLPTKNDAVIWRGPRKNGLIKQFLTDVIWGQLDYLIIDSKQYICINLIIAPPGTSDQHISIAQYLKKAKVDGAVVVTTPQEIALLDVRKELSFCKKTQIPILGVVQNMSGFKCPHCDKVSQIFKPVSGGAQEMCKEFQCSLIGKIPLDPSLLVSCQKGKGFTEQSPESPTSTALLKMIDELKKKLN